MEQQTAKTVLITGASRGIGQAIARKFANSGYNVVINYYNSRIKAEKLANELCRKGSRAVAIGADVGDPVQAKMLVKQTLDIFGKIDVLVNNAGVALYKLLIDCTTKDIENTMLTNLMGAIYTTKEVLPSMIANKYGKIINVSSMWGSVGGSMEAVYSASKGGLESFGKALSKEVGPSNINVNTVSPGVILTDMTKSLSVTDMKDLQYQTSLNRIGQPQDVAELVYFLSTDAANYITGTVIGVDGGIL